MLGEKRGCLPGRLRSSTEPTPTHSTSTTRTCRRSRIRARPLVPAVLAQAEAVGADREETAVALVAGYEVFVPASDGAVRPELGNSVLFERGFHATSIIGAVAGAAACARLLGLDAGGIANAMGIACSLGSGMIEANRAAAR